MTAVVQRPAAAAAAKSPPAPVDAHLPPMPIPLSPSTWRTGGLGNFVTVYPVLVLLPVLYLASPLLSCAWPARCLAGIITVAACREGFRMAPPDTAFIGRGYLGVFFPLCIVSLLSVLLWPSAGIAVAAVYPALLLKAGVCMSVCMHRYASHAAFKCAWPTSLALGVVGCLALQGGPLWWASKHRAHHTFCDGDARDPHSPLILGKVNAFIFFLTGATPRARWRMQAVDEQFVPPHCDSRGMRLVDSFSWLWPLLEWGLALWVFGGAGLWVSFTSAWLCQIATLWFNVRNHLPHGSAHEGKACTAVDTTIPGGGADFLFLHGCELVSASLAPLVGESSHGHHHTHPALARRPGGVDLPYALCATLAALGLVWNVKA